jgi:hypothetical protein
MKSSRAACIPSMAALGSLAALQLCAGISGAATVPLNGTGQMSCSFQFVAPNATTPTVADDYALALPDQHTFLDQFTTQQSSSQIPGTSSVGAYSFQDSHRFSVGAGAIGDTLVAQLGLPPTYSVSNLQFRLYDVAAATSTVPIVGGVPAGSLFLTAWKGIPSGQSSVTASFSGVQGSHTYLLDVAGVADGTHGGTYVGQLNLAPVPLPAALPLLLSGLGLFGASSRRRRRA